MKKNKTVLAIFLAGCLAVFSSSANATVLSLDLNDFFADPTVSIAGDGLSATMLEDEFSSTVLLSNDPDLGDPNIIIPSAGAMLKFEYSFSEDNNNDDGFFADILEGGASIANFSTFSSGSGTVSFDLSTLLGKTLGLQFELSSFENPFDANIHLTSLVDISNLRIETPDVKVPLPPMTGLMFVGLIWLKVVGSRRKLKNK